MVIAEESKITIVRNGMPSAYAERNCQFISEYTKRGYPLEVNENCLKMYVNGLGFRARERITRVNHNTVIRWVRNAAETIPDAPEVQEIPEITEIDELQTFVGKKNKRWIWTTVNHWKPGMQPLSEASRV